MFVILMLRFCVEKLEKSGFVTMPIFIIYTQRVYSSGRESIYVEGWHLRRSFLFHEEHNWLCCWVAYAFQVPESDILNALDESKSDKYIHLEDNVFEFAKRRALESIVNSLETRPDISGYSSHLKVLLVAMHVRAITILCLFILLVIQEQRL